MSRWGMFFVMAALLLVPVQALAQTPSPTPSSQASPTPSPSPRVSPTPRLSPSPSPTPTPTPVPLLIDDASPQAGQYVVIRGTACPAGEPVRIGIDRAEIAQTSADRFGAFKYILQIPPDVVDNVTFTLFAICEGRTFSVAIEAGPQFRGDMTVTPESVGAGGTTILRGGGCQPGSPVRFFLDDTEIGPAGTADDNTQFNNEVRIPRGTRARVYAISARCGDHAAVDEITVQGDQVGQTPGGGVQTGIATASTSAATRAGGAGVALVVAAAGVIPLVRRLRARVRGTG